MDAKKLAAAMVAVTLAVPVIAKASPGALAMIEIGLIGVLYLVRRRRSALEGWR